ncbi:MAG: MBL fold metallo-hydrolase [Prevotella sp.]|jgi:7,8-dihydropterin-6-yl-methyl-4-(beta-D-ribofuranosyl)aminobenzene 5'-phosphate synthase|nr:MBL fold metallo-hydrolase [Prevotella sp.]
MKITILVDNHLSDTVPGMSSEHGLSIYIEDKSARYLLDTGASDLWAHNARLLGIPIENIDHLILSHGHIDHTGGLPAFISLNQRARIIASEKITEYQYYSHRHPEIVDLTPPENVINTYRSRFLFIREDYRLNDHIKLVFTKQRPYPVPEGNRFLTVDKGAGEKPYTADDEIALAIENNGALTIISSCSHGGILNIIRSCVLSTGISRVTAFIGGLHLIDLEPEKRDDVKAIADTLKRNYPDIDLYIGHCTGKTAYHELKKALGNQVHKLYCGRRLTIGS